MRSRAGRRLGLILPILPAAAALSGCGASARAPAADRLTRTGEEQPALKSTLSSAEQRRIEAAFRDLAATAADDRHPDPPRAAEHGVRWSDLEDAVLRATAELEMAVVARTDEPWGARFSLRTIEDRPAELVVRRLEPPAMYEAEATVGRFGDDTRRARALVEALDRWWRAFGRKRGWE